MSLCKYCGVEVEEDARCCPLCRNPLQPGMEVGQPRPEPSPTSPQEAPRGLRRWLLEIFSLLAAMGAIVVFAADFASGMSLSWAHNPLASIAFLWLAVAVLILGSGRIWLILPAEVAAVSLFLFALDGFSQGRDWFLPLAFPVTLLAGTTLALTLALVRTLDLSPFVAIATAMSAAAVFVVGLELLLNRYLAGHWFVSWSAMAFACTLPLLLLLLYLRRRFKPRQAEIRKLLHR